MWSQTRSTNGIWILVLVPLLLLHTPDRLYGQTLQSNNSGNTQQAIIKPEKPRGPGSLAPNPKPPEPPKIDSYKVTPPKPDDDDKETTPDRSREPDSPKPIEPIDPGTAGEKPEQGQDSTASPQIDGVARPTAVSVETPTSDAGLRLRKVQSRVQAMQSRLIDAPRPTFSLQQAEIDTESSQPAQKDFEPAQVLLSVSGLDEAKQIQNALAGEGYRVRSRRVFRQLDMVVLNLRTPKNVSAQQAVLILGSKFPDAITELNHRYSILGTTGKKAYAGKLVGWQSNYLRCLNGSRIGMIDTAVAADHPAFVESKLEVTSVLVGGTKSASGHHGTGVAAILASTSTDGYATGIASSASLVSVEAFRENVEGKIDTTVELVISAMEVLLGKKVTVMNLSFGGPQNKLLAVALGAVMKRNVLVIAAAGNQQSSSVVFPAAYDGVIAVTAVDANGVQMKGITQADYIDFAAPGVDVWTAAANGRGKYVSGTSFAVPYVTALVSSLQQQHPELSRDQHYQRLKQLASDLGEPGKDKSSGWGLINWPKHCVPAG